MTVLSDYVARMVAGVTHDEAMQIAAEIFAAGAACQAARPSAGALRTRKWREKTKSQGVTSDVRETQTASDAETSQSVTDRHKASQVTFSENVLPSILLEKEDKKEKKEGRKNGSRITSDWMPSDRDRDFAKSLGWSDAQIDSEAENFRDYWIAAPGRNACKLCWSATWRKWIRNSKVKPVSRPGVGLVVNTDNVDWRGLLEFFGRTNRWPRELGSDPTLLSCRAPYDLLVEYGYRKARESAA